MQQTITTIIIIKMKSAPLSNQKQSSVRISPINVCVGFTLIELMVVIAIIAILGAVAVPAYQRYIQKASMTDMLQSLTPYKTAIELCSLQNELSTCSAGQFGIPTSHSTRYVSDITVNQGVITLTGQQGLQGLNVTLTPKINVQSGMTEWERVCTSTKTNLIDVCEEVLVFSHSR